MNRISIKNKWTLVVVVLVGLSIILTGYFMLNGILINQKEYYADFLMSSSKDANLFLRESYTSTDYGSLKEYYLLEAEKIAIDLRRVINLPVELLDEYGQIISNKENIRELQNKNIIDLALTGQPLYEKIGSKIVYLAPIYDYNEQIGVFKIQYSTEREDSFYKDMRILYYKTGIYFTILTSILGVFYFSKVADGILDLKRSVKYIGMGIYDDVKYSKTNDELEDLGMGISELSNIIEGNIGSLKNEKNKLESVIARLTELELQQNEFIGNITHEFKTPLTVLKIQVDLMDLYKDDEDIMKNSKDIINKELKRLDGMVENILYLSKIQKYEYEFNQERINTKDLLIEIIYRLKDKALKSGIEIIEDLEEAYIYVDKNSFIQILMNLLDNGIKYNVPNGKILVTSFIKDNKNYIQVKNTGFGISKDDQEKVFEPFYIVDQSRNKKISGTGLGLPLVKNLVEKQGGKVSIKSSKGLTSFQLVFVYKK